MSTTKPESITPEPKQPAEREGGMREKLMDIRRKLMTSITEDSQLLEKLESEQKADKALLAAIGKYLVGQVEGRPKWRKAPNE